MEMLNIPPAQPQGAPSAPAKSGTGKEANGFFREALDNAGTSQAKGLQKETGKAEEQATEATAEAQNSLPSGTAAEAELLLETLPTDSNGTAKPVEEPEPTVDSEDMAETALPVLVGELLPAPGHSSATTKTLGNQDAEKGITTNIRPLPGKPGPNAQESTAASLAEASVSDGESEIETLASIPKVEGVAETAGQPLTASKTGPTTPSMAPAVGLRAGNPTADSRRQSTPQPVAVTTIVQTGVPQGEQQKALEATEGRKQPGLMESSLGSLLQEVRPLRGELRGQAATEGNRNPALSLAASAGEPRPAAASAQNGDTLSSFSFEQKTEAMLNGLGEETAGTSPAADGTLFDAALNSSLHTAQAVREGAHPLATGTAEADSIRLSSGELLSENQVVDQVLQRIHLEGGNEQSRIVIKMHPEELGEVKLALTLEKDQLRAQLLTQSQQVQEVLEKHLPRLHEALSQQGVRLEDIQVSVDSNRHSGREFFDQQQQPNSFNRHFNAPPGSIADEQAVAASMATQRDLAAGLSLRV